MAIRTWSAGRLTLVWIVWPAFLLLGALCLGCARAPRHGPAGPPETPALPPAAAGLAGHLSTQEARNLAVIRQIHEGTGVIRRARESGLLAADIEWWVAGPPAILPFAGTWRGQEGIAEFERKLDETMRYDQVDLREYLASGDQVAAIFLGAGIARATGHPFRSEIVRLYTLREGKIVRVRNFYDTAIYVAAVRPD